MRRIKFVTAAIVAAALTTISAAVVDATSNPPETPPATVETEAPTTAAPTTELTTEAPTTIQVIVTDAPTTGAPEAPTTEAPIVTESANDSVATPQQVVDASTTVAIAPTSTSNPNQVNQDQQSVVTATVVANANTGNNAEVDESGQPGGSQLPAEIETGDAKAVGSQDANVVTQGAEITVQDQAVANVLQVALILNVGVALANSGYNGVSSTPGGAGVTAGVQTGDANATGLDIGQYITQAARENGDENTDAHANQLAISLWMGVGTANTGLNGVAGTGVGGGSGGAVAAGDASATGNLSTTNIDQYAQLLGEDTATLNVTQRATVLNVGFALANSGINDISGVAGGLLSADPTDDNAYAQDLFAMLLPALLQSYGYGPAAGSVATGDATATGNDSDTFVRQVALAASSGDGVVDIVQQVLVANVGAAGANSGGNVLGGGIATLDPESASAIVMMAAFMADMLSLVHQSANGATMDAVSRGIDVPFQGLLLRLDASFEGLDTTFTNEGGAQANMRQVTIIVSLGLANANSGNNTTMSQVNQGNEVNGLQAGDAVQVLSPDNLIGTGDADAASHAQVVLCQRINADDVACLEPPTTTIAPPDGDDPGGPTTTVVNIPPTTVVSATTTTTVIAPTTTCPAPPTTATTAPVDPAVSVLLPPGFTAGMLLPLTC